MSISRTTSDRDLLLELRPGRGSRSALEEALREAICSGRLTAGAALPSTRVLARDLGIARSTVSEVYTQLTVAGYLHARQGAGTWVASSGAALEADDDEPPASGVAPRFDLRPGVPDLASFPRLSWQRALRRALAGAPPEVFAPGEPRGRPELRAALASYLGRARGVLTTPARLVVCNGFSQELKLVYDVLRLHGVRRIGVEDPSLWFHLPIAEAAGLEPVPIPVDEEGLTLDGIDDLDVGAVLVTPAHQFPLGATMSSRRRAELVAWASRREAIVVEDDYDGEFRFDRRPIGAVQGLAPERVVYCGTAGKTLAPGVRVAWIAMPPALLGDALKIRGVADRYAGVLDQLALAELIESGDFDRHVRRMRRTYRRRRDTFVSAVRTAAPTLAVRGTEAGLHAVLELPDGIGEEELLARAEERSVGVHGLSPYRHGSYAGPQALVAGYGTPADFAFSGCLEAFVSFLEAALS